MASFHSLSVNGSSDDIPAEDNPDKNIDLRGYEPTSAALELVEIGPLVDPKRPNSLPYSPTIASLNSAMLTSAIVGIGIATARPTPIPPGIQPS